MGSYEQDEPEGKGWRAGQTFFEESGGKPAKPAGASESDQGTGEEDVHLPASEADTGGLTDEGAEPQSWPGKGGPGTFPPPG